MPPRGKLYDKTGARDEARRALFAAARLLKVGIMSAVLVQLQTQNGFVSLFRLAGAPP
jgi:hypothetical protein